MSERLAERERIGREVHDGVLQVLAMINRRGRDLGPEGEQLADMAADQERSLRSLITRFEPASGEPSTSPDGQSVRDLAASLATLRSSSVEVVLPAGSVRLPAATAQEIQAAVVAALDNVSRHAGENARAWVLLDADDHRIEVVIRDNGVGMEETDSSARWRRLGASSSIRGRMLDLGGDASWRTPGGGGTTVTLTVPAAHMAGSTP